MRPLLLATRNNNKIREFTALLKGLPFELVTLQERKDIPPLEEESGATLEENAGFKAKAAAAASRLLALGEDSGLEVEALGGEPGVRTARYAGPDASDEERNRYLLRKLQGLPLEQRRAAFRCVIAIAEPEGEVRLCQGKVNGLINPEPRGSNGWGYDPVFLLPDRGKTLAELAASEKNRLSHRFRAVQRARRLLLHLVRSGHLSRNGL